MKANKLLFASALAAVAMTTACQKSPAPESDFNSAVKFSSKIANQVVTKAANNAWENNDAIGVFMKTGAGLTNVSASNKKYVTNNGSGNFTAASTAEEIFFPEDGSKVDFIAYYPYQAALTNNAIAVNVADQSQQSKIDILYANNAKDASKTNPNAQLVFNHALSKVEVTVTKGNGVASLNGLAVQFNGFNTTANFELSSGILTGQGTKASFAAKTTAGASSTVAEAIVLPVSNVSGATVVFKLAQGDFTWPLPTTTNYEAGKKYSYNVTLTTDAAGNQAAVVTATITDWIDVPSGSYVIGKDEDGGTTPTDPTTPGESTVLFTETFGTEDLSKANPKPKIEAYKGWDNTSLVYSDQFKTTDVRSTGTLSNHLWFPANKDAEFKIDNINTDKVSDLKVKFAVTTNASKELTFDVNKIKLTLNGKDFFPASRVLTATEANKFSEVEVDLSSVKDLPKVSSLVFYIQGTSNTVGVRIDDISLSGLK
ncbi:fimbrillin family protein [Sphingobacterium sp. Mn56C]|uniref:fimbrillin family protein n=1 Tax=Sphingobacterium sp. Mn56C TaxID=3395261 RepID=UPI003BECE5EC